MSTGSLSDLLVEVPMLWEVSHGLGKIRKQTWKAIMEQMDIHKQR